MKEKENKVVSLSIPETKETMELDERAVWSISNWAFAWLFDFADFGEEEEPNKKPVVSW